MSSESNNHINLKTFLVTVVTLVSVNTVSEIIKRKMPVAQAPMLAPATTSPVRTPNSSGKAPNIQQKSVKNTDSFEKKMAARSKDRRSHYLPIHIVHN